MLESTGFRTERKIDRVTWQPAQAVGARGAPIPWRSASNGHSAHQLAHISRTPSDPQGSVGIESAGEDVHADVARSLLSPTRTTLRRVEGRVTSLDVDTRIADRRQRLSGAGRGRGVPRLLRRGRRGHAGARCCRLPGDDRPSGPEGQSAGARRMGAGARWTGPRDLVGHPAVDTPSRRVSEPTSAASGPAPVFDRPEPLSARRFRLRESLRRVLTDLGGATAT